MSETTERDYCPTCGATGRDEQCATRTGRDHPSRRVWGRAFEAGVQAERARLRDVLGSDAHTEQKGTGRE